MRIVTRAALSTIAAITVLLSGCYRGPSAAKHYGRSANPDRSVRGLPPIPENWREDSQYTFAAWHNPARADPANKDKPMHFLKEVRVDQSGMVLKEADHYQSGKMYPSLDPDCSGEMEVLEIVYDFQAAREGKNPWCCYIGVGPHEGTNKQPDMKLVDDFLKEWGLERLK